MEAGKSSIIPALGRPFEIGTLYNSQKDEIIPDVNLCGKSPKEMDASDNFSASKFKASDCSTFDESACLLEVGGDLMLSVQLGLVVVQH